MNAAHATLSVLLLRDRAGIDRVIHGDIMMPIEQELERRGCERMVRLYQKLGEMDHNLAQREDFGDFIRTVYIDLSKQIGFPKETEIPTPEFNRADLATPQTDLPPKTQEQKLTNKPVEPFDNVNESWVCCPTCGSKKIHYGGKDGKKDYCACFDCRIFLNVSKTGEPVITEMKK